MTIRHTVDALARSSFESGDVGELLAHRVALLTDSQKPENAAIQYLDKAIGKSFDAIGFAWLVPARPKAKRLCLLRSMSTLRMENLMNVKSILPMLVLLMVSAGFSSSAFAQDDTLLASIKRAGEVKGAIASSPPLMGISPTGKATGYMADITNLALKGMGLPELTPVLTDWSAMIPSLQAKHIDMVVPGMQANEARCKAAIFSAPVFVQRSGLFVKAGNPKNMTTVSRLAKNPELKLAVVPGGNPETYALSEGVKPDQLVRVSDDQGGVSAVVGGRADAYLAGQYSFAVPIKQRKLDVVVDMQSPFVVYGVVFRKEDVKFRDALSAQINALRTNGKMREVLMKFAAEAGIAEKDIAGAWDTLSKIQKVSDVVPTCE